MFGMTTGFVIGIAFFLLLSKYSGRNDEDESDDEDAFDEGESVTRYSSASAPDRIENSSPRSLRQPCKIQIMKESIAAQKPFPLTLAAAVATDAAVDGLLIGISSTSGAQAGIVITAALSIEMGFLGLTYASALTKQPLCWRLVGILVPPVLLILGGVTGDALGALVSDYPPLHTGLLSFGVAALLYLVTEELLLEAHSSVTEEHIWWVDAMFFLGFYLSFLLEKYSRKLESFS